MKFPFLILFCWITSISWTQKVFMDSCWSSPIGIIPELSAGFGDIRPNHFHMGLDFRTNGVEGIPLFSIADGFISRIRVSPGGYGRVIYIDHPNGLTSVYAHCSRFSDRITTLVTSAQIQFEQNEFDWKLSPDQLPVRKGEQIAFSGNSGNSTGPHLHFELRDSKSEHALNPFLFGFHVNDLVPPKLHGIRVVAIDQNGYLIPTKSFPVTLTKWNHTIQIPKDFIAANEKIGICISATDQLSHGGNGFGLFSAELRMNSSVNFGFELKDISFDDSRYVNSHIDYLEYKAKGIKFQKLFRTKNNPLTIYSLQSIGGISLQGKDSISCSLILSDVNGNESQHMLQIVNPFELVNERPAFYSYPTYFLPDSIYTFQSANIRVEMDEQTFYEPEKKSLNLAQGQIGSTKSVLQKPVCIKMKALDAYPLEKQYISIGSVALETIKDENWLQTESKQLGTFVIKIDTVKPRIQFMPVSSNEVIPAFLNWKMSDGQSGISSYQLFIDGKWTPIYFDQKNNLVSWKNDQEITIIGPNSGTAKTLTLRVKDQCGNTAEWTKVLQVIGERH